MPMTSYNRRPCSSHLMICSSHRLIGAAVSVSCLFALASSSLAGQTRSTEQQVSATSVLSSTHDTRKAETDVNEYLIGADDVLTLVFWRDEQLSGDVLVRPDGKISVPLLDDVQAAGLTPKQLGEHLAVAARRFVTAASVTVVVKEIHSRKVYITGLVAKPGQYPLTTSMTALQLIATAGGLLDFAKTKDIRIVRVENGRSIDLRFDYEAATKNPMKASQQSLNLELKPGDTVVVP
jgi:polysaccharide biosynthesis/export protein